MTDIPNIARKLCCPGGCRAEHANNHSPDRLFKQQCLAQSHEPDVCLVLHELHRSGGMTIQQAIKLENSLYTRE